MIRFLLIVCFVAVAAPSWGAEKAYLSVGEVVSGSVRVLDGGTYLMDGMLWREYGLVAPEMSEAHGPEARAALDKLVAGKPISCTYLGWDRYNRAVGQCVNADGRGLALEVLRGGWAFVHRLYVSDKLVAFYDKAEAEARDAGRGFWAKPVEPTRTPTRDWLAILQGLTPLIAVILVGLTALFAWLIRRWERNQERLALAASIASEISATIAITERRDYVGMGNAYIQNYDAGQNTLMPRLVDTDLSSKDLIMAYPVFHANVGKIGILGPEAAAEIAVFYTQMIGITGSLLNWAKGGWDEAPLQIKAGAIAEEIAQWNEAKTLGLKLCADTLHPRRKK